MAVDGIYAGRIILSDTIKLDAAAAVFCLSEVAGKEVVMLTGDNREASDKLAKVIGIQEYYPTVCPRTKSRM
jgi:Cd2+/Zn2+-exporting ATPase